MGRNFVKFLDKKTVLFIEPCLSDYPLVLKAKEKRYRTFVISAHSDQRQLPEDIIDASTSFFQVETNQDAAVLDLVKKINQKFRIDGVISGNEAYLSLTNQVAASLNKPGISPEAAHLISNKDLMRETLKAHNISQQDFLVEELTRGKDYNVIGFLRHNAPSLISIMEKIPPPKTHQEWVGYIIYSKPDFSLVAIMTFYLKKVTSALGLDHGPFCAQIRLSQGEPLLMGISTHLAGKGIPELMRHGTGMDYYGTILKVLCSQPLSFQTKPFLNSGIAYFSGSRAPNKLKDNPYVKAIHRGHDCGYVIFLHENDETLKEMMTAIHLI